MPSSRWKIAQLAIIFTCLGYGLPAQANDRSSSANWQDLCQQYFSASTCATSLLPETWSNHPNTGSQTGASNSLTAQLPSLPADTPESSLHCFMRNIDGSLLDLTQLCNATSSHPLLAHISVSKTVSKTVTAPEPAPSNRKSAIFKLK